MTIAKAPKHWFYLPEIGSANETVVLTQDEAVHAAKVLRQKSGDMIGLIDGSGRLANAVIREISGAGKKLLVTASVTAVWTVTPPQCKLHLYIALTKAKQMAQSLKQAVELGVWEITPILCTYSVASTPAGTIKPHWQQDIVSAMKQSRNPFLPVLKPVTTFTEALQTAPAVGFFGDADDEASSRRREEVPDCDRTAVWIGPEGGFSDAEKQLLKDRCHIPVKVAPWVLRVETAVPATIGWLRGRGMVPEGGLEPPWP
ncbi:MAG: RsmE family RNA methyltransferase [Lentisphaeria bacterium]